jgi:hypothetical protein
MFDMHLSLFISVVYEEVENPDQGPKWEAQNGAKVVELNGLLRQI